MKLTLAPGFVSASGTFAKYKNGDKIILKTYNRNGKPETRAYAIKKHERTTKLSAAEMAARELFTRRQAFVQELFASGQCTSKADAWKKAKETIR